MGLRMQITIPFIILTIFAVGIVAFVSYNFSVKTTTEELSRNVENQMISVNETFDMYFTNMENQLTRMANDSTLRHYTDEENFSTLYTFLQQTADTDPQIQAAYAGFDAAEEIIIYPNDEAIKEVNPKDRAWYQDAIAAEGTIVWTEPYQDALTGNIVITAAKAFYQYSDVVGVAGIDIQTKELLEMMNSITIGDSGYTVVIDENGSYITNPDPGLIGQNISEEKYYQDIMAAGEQGLVDGSLDGEDIVIGFVKNPTTDWTLGGIIQKGEFESKAGVILVPIAISLGAVLILAIISAMIIARRITKPIEQLQTTMKQVEDGDLTVNITTNRKDEIGLLSKSFERMVKQIQGVMKQINGVSYQVSDAAQNLVASSEENTASANEVATTMEEIASGASNQFDLTEQNANDFTSFSEMIKEINNKNEEMFEKAQQMGKLSTSGVETIQDLATRSAETTKQAKGVTEAIQLLNEKASNIHSIVDKIANIASQTNLLALNASIEAARAGEHGHGFAVVANEVGKLAEQTTDALKDVAVIISEMQDETQSSVDLVKQTTGHFDQQSESVAETGQVFLSISSAVDENNKMIEQIMSLTDKIVEREQELIKNTQQFAAISEDTAAGTEEISASIEEQTASMEQLTQLATDLESYAILMQEGINRFKI